jgi:hypothetical protein
MSRQKEVKTKKERKKQRKKERKKEFILSVTHLEMVESNGKLQLLLEISFWSKNKQPIVKGNYSVPWLRRLVAGLSPRSPGFDPSSAQVGFVVDIVALGQVLLRVLRFSPVDFIPPVLH